MFRGNTFTSIAFAGLLMAMMMPQAWAADESPNARQSSDTSAQRAEADRAARQRAERKTQHVARQRQIDRASQLIGMSVQDPAGKSVGEIEDLVIETRSGRIAYVALRYDQTLGFGGKLAAVSPQALTISQNGEDKQIRLNKRVNELQSAPSIDTENWPDATDKTWRNQLDAFYRVQASDGQGRVGSARPDVGIAETHRNDAGIDRPSAKVELHQRDQRPAELRNNPRSAVAVDQPMVGSSYRVSQLIGMDVLSRHEVIARAGQPDVGDQAAENIPEEQMIGTVRDVLINRSSDRAMFVLIDYGGTLGVGEQTAVAPFAAMRFTRQKDGAPSTARLNADLDTLKKNRITAEHDVASLAQSDRSRQVFESYDQTPQWQTFGYESADSPRQRTSPSDHADQPENTPRQ